MCVGISVHLGMRGGLVCVYTCSCVCMDVCGGCVYAGTRKVQLYVKAYEGAECIHVHTEKKKKKVNM